MEGSSSISPQVLHVLVWVLSLNCPYKMGTLERKRMKFYNYLLFWTFPWWKQENRAQPNSSYTICILSCVYWRSTRSSLNSKYFYVLFLHLDKISWMAISLSLNIVQLWLLKSFPGDLYHISECKMKSQAIQYQLCSYV